MVERWILACLRHEVFYTLAQLNHRIGELLQRLNDKPFQKLPGSRAKAFETLDKPALRPLPCQPYVFTRVKPVKVHLDYHVDIDRCYYSVPHALVKKTLQAYISEGTVRLLHQGHCVAEHTRLFTPGTHRTLKEHRPKQHRVYMDWNPGKFKQRAQHIGPHVLTWVTHKLASRRHPEQAYRACMGLLSLTKGYGNERLNAACHRGLETGAVALKNIKAILKHGLDKQTTQPLPNPLDQLGTHANLRDPHEFH